MMHTPTSPITTIAARRSSISGFWLYLARLFVVCVLFGIPVHVLADTFPRPSYTTASTNTIEEKDPIKAISRGTFLVATKNLSNSSFQQTVILITHYDNRGTTGLAINRPSQLKLNEAFPETTQLKDVNDELYLGGPVRPEAVFVLMQTKRPHAGMRNIAEDVYFAAGLNAFTHGKDKSEPGEQARAYAGYTGWAPGQLENEIRRGDWLVIQSDLDIIFVNDNQSLWKTLFDSWSGTWI